ncbi:MULTISPECIES: PhnA domain-containing protein [Zobellia]|uniref:PhnA domain-containing protein n=1 Tax=Zobellia TaxID=112040 RepID=UPI001889FC24|nr:MULTISPECIES: alkylphosphonate utilization protein [Zobellia]MBU2947719.1 PhnA domain-containing protein [Zobellia uliginosa]
MSVLADLEARSGSTCELCTGTNNLEVFEVEPVSISGVDSSILACETCRTQIEDSEQMDANHWRCLNDSMWSEYDSVKVVAWRMLSRLKSEGWPKDLLEMMYLEPEVLDWAKATGEGLAEADKIIHRDVNGVILENGDSVVLVKDLKIKGSSQVAKQGTAVRRISLDRENAEYIEGKVGPTMTVIITKYVKKI